MNSTAGKVSGKLFVSLLLIFAPVSIILGQTNFSLLPSGLSAYQHSQDGGNKNYLIPAAEVFTLNIAVWAVDNYILNKPYSEISWETMERNLKKGFTWDEDKYIMNHILHPIHGTAYYNFARANNLDFWESSAYAIGGSLMWEYFMENTRPSYNDFVITPVTGAYAGEIIYRITDMLLTGDSEGFTGFARKFFGAALNPANAVHRLISGGEFRPIGYRPPYEIELWAGGHNSFANDAFNNIFYFSVKTNLNYGSLYSVNEHRRPFDYFTLQLEFDGGRGSDLFALYAEGVLDDIKIDLPGGNKLVAGAYGDIDILTNNVYKFSSTGVTGMLSSRFNMSKKTKLDLKLGAVGVLMGATNTKHEESNPKNYNIGPGAGIRTGLRLNVNDLGALYLNYNRYWVHTLSGTPGEDFAGLAKAGTDIKISGPFSLGLEYLLYERQGYYDNYSDYQSDLSALRIYTKYRIN